MAAMIMNNQRIYEPDVKRHNNYQTPPTLKRNTDNQPRKHNNATPSNFLQVAQIYALQYMCVKGFHKNAYPTYDYVTASKKYEARTWCKIVEWENL